jgi:hypothetical protein
MEPLDWDALASAKEDAAFAEDAWLTFYVCGDPSCHDAMKPALVALGARNLEGAEGGFVYAKVPVTLDAKDIEQTVNEVRHLAAKFGLEIDAIDLDSSDDIYKTKAYFLWNAG